MRILDFEAIGKTPTEEITHRSTEGTIPGKLGREFVAFIIQSCDLQACDAPCQRMLTTINVNARAFRQRSRYGTNRWRLAHVAELSPSLVVFYSVFGLLF